METVFITLAVIAMSGICFWLFIIEHAGRFTISELGDLMADHEDIFFKILTVVGVVLFVLIVIYDVTVAIERNANRAAGRNVIDTLLNDICTHRVVGCRVT